MPGFDGVQLPQPTPGEQGFGPILESAQVPAPEMAQPAAPETAVITPDIAPEDHGLMDEIRAINGVEAPVVEPQIVEPAAEVAQANVALEPQSVASAFEVAASATESQTRVSPEVQDKREAFEAMRQILQLVTETRPFRTAPGVDDYSTAEYSGIILGRAGVYISHLRGAQTPEKGLAAIEAARDAIEAIATTGQEYQRPIESFRNEIITKLQSKMAELS